MSIGTFFVAIFVGPMIDYCRSKEVSDHHHGRHGLKLRPDGIDPWRVLRRPYLTVVRTFSGLGYSEQAVNTTYLNEIYGNRKSRGFIYAFIQGGWPIGVLLAAAFHGVVAGNRGVARRFPARHHTGAHESPASASGFGSRPRFLAMQRVRQLEKEGRHEEAVEFGRDFDIDVHHVARDDPAADLRAGHPAAHDLPLPRLPYQLDRHPGLRRPRDHRAHGGQRGLVRERADVLIISNAAAYIGYLCHGFVGDRIGRRLTIAGGWVISGLAYTLDAVRAEFRQPSC